MSLRALCFFFTDTATPAIYTLSLHDALPIFVAALLDALWLVPAQQSRRAQPQPQQARPTLIYEEVRWRECRKATLRREIDRKSTRLNSSHGYISYAVFCLKKKKKQQANISET